MLVLATVSFQCKSNCFKFLNNTMSEDTGHGKGEVGGNEEDTALASGGIQQAVMGMPPTIPVPGAGGRAPTAAAAAGRVSPFQAFPMMDPMQMQMMLQQQHMLINSLQQSQAASAAAPKATGKKKGGGGAMRFTGKEHQVFLDAMEEVLPLGHEDWLDVLNKFNSQVDEDRHRDKAALQQKWNLLIGSKKPTGDPNCPWHIKKAKRIDYARSTKTGMSTFGTEEEKTSDLDSLDLDGGSGDQPGLQSDPSDLTTDSAKTPSSNKRKSKPAELKKNPPSKKKGKPKNDEEEIDAIGIVMTQQEESRKAAMEERKRERKQRRHEQQLWMGALRSMTECVVAAITQNPNAISKNPTINIDMESDSESLSSYSSNDTPPTKRLKIKAGKTKKSKKSKKTQETQETQETGEI